MASKKFKPIKFGASIIGISVAVIVVLGFVTPDLGLALEFLPPELRIVGGCFRDCLDEDQTGFGGQDPVPDPIPATIIETDPITGEEIEVEGTIDFNGNFIPLMCTENQVEVFDSFGKLKSCDQIETDEPLVCPSGQVVGSQGKCVEETIMIGNSEFTLLTIDQPIACWLNVHANILDADGKVIGTEASGFFRTTPVPTLDLTDEKTGVEFDQGGYELFPMLKCATNEEGGLNPDDNLFLTLPPFIYPSFDIPLKLEPATLQFRVYSVFDGGLIETYNAPITIKEQSITGAESIQLGEHTIGADRILVFLPNGEYNSFQHIALEGTLVVHWNTGDPTIDNVPQLIQLQTQKTFSNGKLVQVENDLLIFRELIVAKNVSGGENPPEINECPAGQVPLQGSTTACTPIGGDGCGDNQVRVNGFCVTITGGTGGGGTDPKVQNIIDQFFTCIESGSTDCLASTQFLPFYLLGVGVVVLVIGAGQRKQPDIYGVPRGF